ncbi:MAG: prepilin peptidase [Chloroflexi bacterium]|nr:prepilin peptidase [Chloroflexota bacterium]
MQKAVSLDVRQFLYPSARYLFLGALVFVQGYLAIHRYGLTTQAATTAIYCWLLLAIALYDLTQRRIPDRILWLAVPVITIDVIVQQPPALLTALLGGMLGYGVFWIIASARPGAMGWGDVKLAGLVGTMVGYPHVFYALLLGIIFAGVAALFLVLSKRADLNQTMAYGPYLVMGAWLLLLFGQAF